MSKVQVNIGDAVKQGFELYKQNFWLLVLVNLVASVLSALTIGILTGPMMAGVVIVTLGLIDRRTPKPVLGDIFKGFEVFLPAFLYMLVLMLVGVLGNFILPALATILGYVATTLTVFSLFFIVEDRMDFWPAIVRSYNVVKDNFLVFFGLVLVACLLSSVGFLACCIGIIFTMPLYYCIIAVVYRQHFPAGSVVASDSIAVDPPKPEDLNPVKPVDTAETEEAPKAEEDDQDKSQ